MTKPPLIGSEFPTAEEAEAYDVWFRAKVRTRMVGRNPSILHDEVMAKLSTIIEAQKARQV